MRIGTQIILVLGVVLSFASGSAWSDNLTYQRSQFLLAEKALQRGDRADFLKLRSQLVNYPLYPYLFYQDLEQRMADLPLDDFTHFMNHWQHTPLAKPLRKLWLAKSAEQNNWAHFLSVYTPQDELGLQCQYLWAQTQTRPSLDVWAQVTPLWMKAQTEPKACEPLFQAWQSHGLMTKPMIWQRIKAAIAHGNIKLAQKLSLLLKKSDKNLIDLWIFVHNSPQLISDERYFKSSHPAVQEILVHGISRIAKEDPIKAMRLWPKLADRYEFSTSHWGTVVRNIAISFALSHHEQADRWLSRVPEPQVTAQVHEWRVRVALLKQDWLNVLKWINNLPPALSHSPEWVYWKARALKAQGAPEAAQQLLEHLALSRHYYGFLASQQIAKPFAFNQKKMRIHAKTLISLSQRPSLARARELQLLGRIDQGRTEWRYGTQSLNETERPAAAKLALDWHMPNWTIIALANAKDKDDLQLRFPIQHADHIHKAAREHSLDPALIFAVTRQESAFMANAQSPAGALGLMQLMPGTAKMMAKRYKVPIRNREDILNISKNIHLGSAYLRAMLEANHYNSVLAAAAYNAGPNRIRRWLPPLDMPADAWIEGIPFHETRNYVKNVLTYTVIYQQILGRPPEMQSHMPWVPGVKPKN